MNPLHIQSTTPPSSNSTFFKSSDHSQKMKQCLWLTLPILAFTIIAVIVIPKVVGWAGSFVSSRPQPSMLTSSWITLSLLALFVFAVITVPKLVRKGLTNFKNYQNTKKRVICYQTEEIWGKREVEEFENMNISVLTNTGIQSCFVDQRLTDDPLPPAFSISDQIKV